MRKIILISLLLATAAVSACSTANQYPTSAAERTVGGALAGAVIADLTGGSKTQGALIGAVAGGVSCGLEVGLPPCR